MSDLIVVPPGVLWASLTASSQVSLPVQNAVDISPYTSVRGILHVYKAAGVITSFSLAVGAQNAIDDSGWQEGVSQTNLAEGSSYVLELKGSSTTALQRYLIWRVVPGTTGKHAFQLLLSCDRA